jgi:uncharacterized membrane protein YhaH (DUF805 family)
MKNLRRPYLAMRQGSEALVLPEVVAPNKQTGSADIRTGQKMNLASVYCGTSVAPGGWRIRRGSIEDLLEFLFNATGRINRAKYWRSLIVFSVAGLFAAIVLFTAAGIAAPLFIVMLLVVFIPWLMWGFVIHADWPHDRDKSAGYWCSTVAKMASFAGAEGLALCHMLGWRDLRSRSGDLLKSAACRGPADRTATAPIRFCRPDKPAG